MSETEHAIPILDGLAEIAGRYEAFVLDVWGVLHDGTAAYPDARECIRRLHAGGRPVVLVSNAPRPSEVVNDQLAKFGFREGGVKVYDALVTSGDATRAALKTDYAGRRFYHLGPDRDRPLFEGLDLRQADLDDAEFILCTGLFDDETETPRDYRELLERARARRLELVCANPDEIVNRGVHTIYCAGALARLYTDLGGRVRQFGKPHAPVYQLARKTLEARAGHAIAPGRILAVGDGLQTDIRGAEDMGFHAVFVTGGIHADEFAGPGRPPGGRPDVNRLSAACRKAGVWPHAAIPRFTWEGGDA